VESTRQNEVALAVQLQCVPVNLSWQLMFHCGYTLCNAPSYLGEGRIGVGGVDEGD